MQERNIFSGQYILVNVQDIPSLILRNLEGNHLSTNALDFVLRFLSYVISTPPYAPCSSA
jgi:hypothetical protein